jgi:hypothetical protein
MRTRTAILIVILALVLSHGLAMAQSGGVYDLTWNSVDGGGGGLLTGGSYTLNGTVGQHEAGSLSGGAYTLVGGFWHGVPLLVHLPVVEKH